MNMKISYDEKKLAEDIRKYGEALRVELIRAAITAGGAGLDKMDEVTAQYGWDSRTSGTLRASMGFKVGSATSSYLPGIHRGFNIDYTKMGPEPSNRSVLSSVQLFVRARYAPALEYGTRRSRAFPFFQQGHQAAMDAYIAYLLENVKEIDAAKDFRVNFKSSKYGVKFNVEAM